MSSGRTSRPRPYWHVDGKWIVGLILVFVLSLVLLADNLVQVTAEEPAVNTLSTVMALALSEAGLDDESDVAQMRELLRDSPDGSIQPIPGSRITINGEEIADLSPRQARLLFMRKLADPICEGGAQELAALADDPDMRQDIIEGGGALDLFTRDTHESLRRGLVILGVVSLVLFIPLILFSYRFGRLGSPGCVLLVASLPGAICSGILSTIARSAETAPPAREAGMTALAGYVASNVLPPLARMIARNYLISLALGLGLMLLAVLGSLVWRLTRKSSD